MLEAYAHVIMMDVYLSEQEGSATSWHSRETAGGEGFCHHPLHLPRWFAPKTSNVWNTP
jgi:hypothetical protein